MRTIFSVSLLLLGCAAQVDRARPSPPGARMGISEAISRGMDYCHRQSLQCRLRDAHLSDGVWKLRYATTTPTETGELDLELDARTRQLLRARQRGVGQHPGGH